MSFPLSVALLSSVYLLVRVLDPRPAPRFRRPTSPRPYLAPDTLWYAAAIGATAVSVFVFRPVLARLAVDPVAGWIADLPLAARLLLGLVVFDLVSFLVHLGLHRSDTLWNLHKV